MSNYQNTSQHYGTPQGSSSQHYGTPQGSAPAPTRRSEATGSTSNDTSSEYRKARWVYILLVILAGGLGIHNFYAGYSGRGALQLCVSIFGGLVIGPIAGMAMCAWAIYEAFTVKKDACGVYFS